MFPTCTPLVPPAGCLTEVELTYSPHCCIRLGHIHLYVWIPLTSRRIFDLWRAWATLRSLEWERCPLWVCRRNCGAMFWAVAPHSRDGCAAATAKETPGWGAARSNRSRHGVISCHKTNGITHTTWTRSIPGLMKTVSFALMDKRH